MLTNSINHITSFELLSHVYSIASSVVCLARRKIVFKSWLDAATPASLTVSGSYQKRQSLQQGLVRAELYIWGMKLIELLQNVTCIYVSWLRFISFSFILFRPSIEE